VLEVEDNGIGIPEALRTRVLERFYRVDGSPGNGCGLGLSIVDEIAKLHGASLDITTPEQGRGTRMIVRFGKI
jgi:two-component system sensor histidine kinase TctE